MKRPDTTARLAGLLLPLALGLLAACTAALGADPAPAAPPSEAAPAQAPDAADAPAPESPDAELHRWLDRLEARGRSLPELRARLRYDRIQGLLGDEQRRFGTLWYDAGPPARFAVHFDRLVLDDAARPQDRWYIYDGRWLAEKLGDQRVFIRRQLAPPDAEPRDLLALGQGPFALPLNQDKAALLERFEVELVPPAEGDPAGTVHLRLTPRPELVIDATRIDLWYDRETLLPRRARTIDDSENESVIDLLELDTDPATPPDAFDTTPPREPGWQVEIKPYEE